MTQLTMIIDLITAILGLVAVCIELRMRAEEQDERRRKRRARRRRNGKSNGR